MPLQDATEPQATEPSGKKFRALVEEINIAESLEDGQLNQIGEDCRRGYEIDKESRKEWEVSFDNWVKLAKQVQEERSFPWQGASNVKYPLMTTAAMQFAARAYPSLVPSNGQIVKARTIGKDMTGEKMTLAERVSAYMSYQIMHEIPYWEEDMDKMLIQLPVVGMMFKKTYWDSVKKTPVSTLVSPKNLIVNYWTKNLKESERISRNLK